MASVAEYTESVIKTHTTYIDNVVTVSTTPTKVLELNPRRCCWTMVNMSANDVYLSLKPELAMGRGFVLYRDGGMVGTTMLEDYEFPTLAIYAIASADSEVYVFEVVML